MIGYTCITWPSNLWHGENQMGKLLCIVWASDGFVCWCCWPYLFTRSTNACTQQVQKTIIKSCRTTYIRQQFIVNENSNYYIYWIINVVFFLISTIMRTFFFCWQHHRSRWFQSSSWSNKLARFWLPPQKIGIFENHVFLIIKYKLLDIVETVHSPAFKCYRLLRHNKS